MSVPSQAAKTVQLLAEKVDIQEIFQSGHFGWYEGVCVYRFK